MSGDETAEQLLQRAATMVAEVIAARVADELTARQQPHRERPATSRRLLSLDQLVERLPEAKKPETWKGWLYERTRRGQIPGCHKIGGRLFFDAETTLAWLENGCTHGELAESAEQSLHVNRHA